MPFIKRARKFVKRAGRAVKRGLKRRYMRRGNLNVARIAKDVMYLKGVINAEKKFADYQTTGNTVGRNNNSASVSGAYYADITPTITEAVTQGGRTGSSIRVASIAYQMQLIQQAQTSWPLRIKVMLLRPTGLPETTFNVTTLAKIFNANPFSSVIDYFSERNSDYMGNWQVLASATRKIPADNLSAQYMITPIKIFRKLKWHIKYSGDTNTIVSGPIYCVVLCDYGDKGTAATGAAFDHTLRVYFYDN